MSNNDGIFFGVLAALIVYGWSQQRPDETLHRYYVNGAHTDYRADAATQTVRTRIFSDVPGGAALYSLSNCQVFDARNWSCNDNPYFLGATDGKVSVVGPGEERTVSWLAWEWLWLRAWLAKGSK